MGWCTEHADYVMYTFEFYMFWYRASGPVLAVSLAGTFLTAGTANGPGVRTVVFYNYVAFILFIFGNELKCIVASLFYVPRQYL